MLPGTPFHSRTAPLCAAQNWRRWGACLVAGSYELQPEREYFAVRTSAALFDVSPLYKYAIRGVDALRLLNRIITRDVGTVVIPINAGKEAQGGVKACENHCDQSVRRQR